MELGGKSPHSNKQLLLETLNLPELTGVMFLHGKVRTGFVHRTGVVIDDELKVDQSCWEIRLVQQ